MVVKKQCTDFHQKERNNVLMGCRKCVKDKRRRILYQIQKPRGREITKDSSVGIIRKDTKSSTILNHSKVQTFQSSKLSLGKVSFLFERHSPLCQTQLMLPPSKERWGKFERRMQV